VGIRKRKNVEQIEVFGMMEFVIDVFLFTRDVE
jgi:hypothetical protein